MGLRGDQSQVLNMIGIQWTDVESRVWADSNPRGA